MVVNDFGRVADIYDATRSLPEEEMKRVLDSVVDAIPGAGPILDVGVGTGRYAKPLQDRGYEVVGADISKKMMAKAKEKGLTRLVFADVQRTPFRDEVFEAALVVHVLHLVSDWVAVVREAARVSKGTVISVIQNSEGNGEYAMRDVYLEMRLQEGYPLDRFEDGEAGLRDRVPPDRLVQAVVAERVADADEEIRHLNEKGQSLTWDVPEEVHKRIIAALREKFGGTTLRSTSRIEVAVWSAPRLRREIPPHSQKG